MAGGQGFCFYPHTSNVWRGAAVAEWLSSWLAEQEDRGSIPGLATWIFRDWLSPASKSRLWLKDRYQLTLILKTTNQPTIKCVEIRAPPPFHSMCGGKNPAPIFPYYTIACGSTIYMIIYSAERKQTSADFSVSPYSV